MKFEKKKPQPHAFHMYIFFTSLIVAGIPLYFGMDTFLLHIC